MKQYRKTISKRIRWERLRPILCLLASCLLAAGLVAGCSSASSEPAAEESPQTQASDKAEQLDVKDTPAAPAAKDDDAAKKDDAKKDKADKKSDASEKKDSEAKDAAESEQGKEADDASSADPTPGEEASPAAPTEPAAPAAPAEPAAPAAPPLEPEPAPQPAGITVSVTIDATRAAEYGYNLGYWTTEVTLPEGASAFDALVATGVGVGGSGYYVSSINGLGERMCGSGSGWLYSVNGTMPGFSCGKYILSPGDSVAFIYTCDMGNDV